MAVPSRDMVEKVKSQLTSTLEGILNPDQIGSCHAASPDGKLHFMSNSSLKVLVGTDTFVAMGDTAKTLTGI